MPGMKILLWAAPFVLLATGCGVMAPEPPRGATTPTPTVLRATGNFPTAAQIEAQKANPDLRFERPGTQGANWVATPTGWGWSPRQQDRP